MHAWKTFGAVALLVLGGSALAGEAPTTSGSVSSPSAAARLEGGRGAKQDQPRPYSQVRWDEDYSYLRDPANRTDWLDPIKYMPLNESGDWYLSLGGQVRDRYEYFNHSNFGGGPQDHDGYNLFRFLPYVDAHFGPVRAFAQFRTAIESGREGGPRGRDMDTADLQQGFLELDLPLNDQANLTLRGGRQQIVFGKERLIGISDWSNAQRNFDGFRATLNTTGNSLDVFWVRPVTVQKYEFDDGEGHTSFAGVYDTISLPGVFEAAKTKLSLYAFALNVWDVQHYPVVTGSASEDRYTVGTEFTTNPAPWDLDVEADYQFGSFHSEAISAFSIAVEGGYTFSEMVFTPRPFIGFDLATGDHDPANGHLGTFNQLFPSGHIYFGYMDFIGRQNIIDLHPGVEMTLLKNKHFAKKMTLRAEYHQFWRDSVHDAVYDATGAVLRAPDGTAHRGIGSELDLLLNWQIDRHLSSYFGYSHFFTGSFLADSGPSKDSDFLYAAVIYTF